jgi:CRP-like cAMP-binding protein
MKANMIDTGLQNLKLQILKNLELFSDLNDDEFTELANISVLCHLEKGTIIYRQGNYPEYIYIINQGKIKSFSHSLSGRIIIANVSQDLIGLQNIVNYSTESKQPGLYRIYQAETAAYAANIKTGRENHDLPV